MSPSPRLSERALNTPPSPIRSLAHLAGLAKKEGKKIYHLNIGQPDVSTPQAFFDGVRKFEHKVVKYENSEGTEELRSAWSDYIAASNTFRVPPENILITTGASEGLVFIFDAICDPGDEVLIFDPTYANYIGFAEISGVELVSISTSLEEGFRLPDDQTIISNISPKTKAVLLCSPNNPTGTVYNREELSRLLQICEDKNLFLVVDETYREIVFDNLEALSIYDLAPENNRVVVIDSLSKRFSLCGARIGALWSSNQELLNCCLSLAQARLSSPTIEQYAAAHMLREIGPEYLQEARAEYERRRDITYTILSEIPGVSVVRPQGAFYSIAKLPVDDAHSFATFLLSDFSVDNETVFIAPAAGFYMTNSRGKDRIRVASVLNCSDIEKALGILAEGLKQYSS